VAKTPAIERLWPKVDKGAADECWRWTGAVNNRGYGVIRSDAPGWPLAYVHRLVYETEVGEIPETLVIDHLCGVRNCVNPAHLEAVTHTENVNRGAATRLNRDMVRTIAEHPDLPLAELAGLVDLDPGIVSVVRRTLQLAP
jgi:hypothetical protein